MGRGQGEDARWQFDGFDSPEFNNETKVGFMLNTDMELLHQLDLDPESSEPLCSVPDADHTEGDEGVCVEGRTRDVATDFASNVQWWVGNFSRAYGKMLENGYGEGMLMDLE